MLQSILKVLAPLGKNFLRPRPQVAAGETDMHAAQQHVPLMYILI